VTSIVGIVGSLRRDSYNRALLRGAAALAPAGVTLAVHGLQGIPLYDADLERAEGLPPAVVALKEAVAAADGLLLATPEYNNSLPGVLKNAVDWLSRPPDDIPRVFHGRAVAVIGASPGGFGTVLAQDAWLPVMRTLQMRPWFGGRLMVSRVHTLLDEDGEPTDPELRRRLQEFVAGFARFAGA
jgi:NAD(P)H-dependent FMN reductase